VRERSPQGHILITRSPCGRPTRKHRPPQGPRDRHDCAARCVASGSGDAVGEARPGHHGREPTRGTTIAWTLVQSRHTCVLLARLWARRIGMEYAGSAWDELHCRGVVWGICAPRCFATLGNSGGPTHGRQTHETSSTGRAARDAHGLGGSAWASTPLHGTALASAAPVFSERPRTTWRMQKSRMARRWVAG
jgi:hypothetical protein